MQRLFKQFSFPGGIPSHVAPETPGSISEGGELGYSLTHAYGAAFDNPDLIVVCVIGDGEAETGALAAGWQSNKFLNPATDGAVLPILHLNGCQDRQPYRARPDQPGRADRLSGGLGLHALLRRGATTRPRCTSSWRPRSTTFWTRSPSSSGGRGWRGSSSVPRWPMIVLVTPKGWTGPKTVDGKPVEGTFRAHQVPFADMTAEHIKLLEEWMHSYRPEELFDEAGALRPELADAGARRQAADGGQPARERRSAAARPRAAGFPRLRGGGRRPGTRRRRVDQGHGPIPRRDHAPQPGSQELPAVRPGRDRLQQAWTR